MRPIKLWRYVDAKPELQNLARVANPEEAWIMVIPEGVDARSVLPVKTYTSMRTDFFKRADGDEVAVIGAVEGGVTVAPKKAKVPRRKLKVPRRKPV